MNIPETVLCIPGNWTDQADLGVRIVRDSGGYLFAGRIMMHMETKDKVELQFEEADPRIVTAFAHGGRHWMGTAEMEKISGHTSVVYLIGEGGSRANAERLMLAAEGLLNAGGLGVKVENSGIAHSPGAWRRFAAHRLLFSAHEAFVLYVRGAQVNSCGMHVVGLPDAVVDQGDASEPAELLRDFTRYLFTEDPIILEGQTFAAAADAPAYRIMKAAAIEYDPGSLRSNPYGMWRLQAVAAQDAPARTGRRWLRFLN